MRELHHDVIVALSAFVVCSRDPVDAAQCTAQLRHHTSASLRKGVKRVMK